MNIVEEKNKNICYDLHNKRDKNDLNKNILHYFLYAIYPQICRFSYSYWDAVKKFGKIGVLYRGIRWHRVVIIWEI